MVSIIILTQNRLDLLKRCVESILKYTTSPFEFVFILQASKQDTVDYIYSIDHQKTFYTFENNVGVTPGRNKGIELASGDYLLFFDDDAFVSEELQYIPEDEKSMDWLQRMTRYYFEDEKVGIVSQTGSYINTDTPGVFWECKGRGAECDVGQGYCFMFSRKVVNAIGGLDPVFGKFWHEESEFALHAKSVGFKVIDADYIGVTHSSSCSGDDGTYVQKINYMFDKWRSKFPEILVERSKWIL